MSTQEKKILKKKITILLLINLIIINGILNAFSVKLSTNSVFQGDTLRVELEEYKKKCFYEIVFQHIGYRFINTDEGELCYIGISPDIGPGNYNLFILEYKNNNIKEFKIKKLYIKKKKFEEEIVNFRYEVRKKIGDPRNKIEREKILESLERITDRKLWKGKFILPVKGRISGDYGSIRKSRGRYLWRHKGVDIAADWGTPIKAAAGGKVVLCREDFNIYGKTVILDHGMGIMSIYFHLSSIDVNQGQKAKKGQKIGEAGSTGLSTGPHLHWGIYVNKQHVNPFWWINNY